MMRCLAVVLLLLLAGCSGSAMEPTSEARHAVEQSRSAVAGKFDYLLFLGVTGTEGDLNWTAYEEALRETQDPGETIADAFEQDRDNGQLGDGRLGSWLTTHFVFDEERRLLGGLYTQYTPTGIHSAYAPFRGPYPGTLALPSLQHHLRMADNGTELCGLLSDTRSWHVDSHEAVQTAMGRSLFAEHFAAHPNGELTYYYFPHLDVEPSCNGSLDTPSNYWMISYTDLDVYLDGGSPMVAEVRIDAATGQVLDERIRPLYAAAPVGFAETIQYSDSALPAVQGLTTNLTFQIKEGATALDLYAQRTVSPSLERSATSRLVAPDGSVLDEQPFVGRIHAFRLEDPQPGTWTYQYAHEPLVPRGPHQVEVRGLIAYA